MAGSAATARAIATRRRRPYGSSCGFAPRSASSPEKTTLRGEHLADAPPAAAAAPVTTAVFPDRPSSIYALPASRRPAGRHMYLIRL